MEPILEFYWAFRTIFGPSAKSHFVAAQSPVRDISFCNCFTNIDPKPPMLAFIHINPCYWGRSIGLVFSCLPCTGRVLCYSAWSGDISPVCFPKTLHSTTSHFCCFRYHVGESMLPSMRHFLRFIEADDRFDSFGFVQKVIF